MTKTAPCPNCSGRNLFKTQKPLSAGGGYAPNYLPGLGSFFVTGKCDVVVCRDCGLMRWFASGAALAKLTDSSKWERIAPGS